MWTNLTLSLHPVWEDLLWSLSATWKDGPEDEPVTIQCSGQAVARGADTPAAILAVVLPSIQERLSQTGGTLRNG